MYDKHFSLKENRLVYEHNWNTTRLVKETAVYAENIDGPVDAVLHGAAAAVHVVTGIGEAVVGDVARLFQSEEARVPLKEYSGDLPRLKLDVSEAVDSVKNTAQGNIASILTLPIVAVKTFGDAVADGTDAFAGIHRPDYSTAA